MEYRGYHATVEFDGKIFFGTIDNISDFVTFESDTAEAFLPAAQLDDITEKILSLNL